MESAICQRHGGLPLNGLEDVPLHQESVHGDISTYFSHYSKAKGPYETIANQRFRSGSCLGGFAKKKGHQTISSIEIYQPFSLIIQFICISHFIPLNFDFFVASLNVETIFTSTCFPSSFLRIQGTLQGINAKGWPKSEVSPAKQVIGLYQ